MLAVYNASGFVGVARAARVRRPHEDYLRPMLACAVLTLALAALLALATSLPVAVIGLVTLGGPAGVGSLAAVRAAQVLRARRPSDVINTRAIMSFAWVAGPPLATPSSGRSATARSCGRSRPWPPSTSRRRPRCSPSGPAGHASAPEPTDAADGEADVPGGRRADRRRLRRPAGHQQRRRGDHEPVRHRDARPRRDLGRDRARGRRGAGDPRPAADRAAEPPVLQPRADRFGVRRRDRVLRRHGRRLRARPPDRPAGAQRLVLRRRRRRRG